MVSGGIARARRFRSFPGIRNIARSRVSTLHEPLEPPFGIDAFALLDGERMVQIRREGERRRCRWASQLNHARQPESPRIPSDAIGHDSRKRGLLCLIGVVPALPRCAKVALAHLDPEAPIARGGLPAHRHWHHYPEEKAALSVLGVADAAMTLSGERPMRPFRLRHRPERIRPL